MKSLATALGACLLVSLAGCSTLVVETDFDRDVNFSQYKTYRWVVTKDRDDPLLSNPLVDKRIKAAVNEGLNARGFVATQAEPDFFIAYHVTSKERVDYRDFDYGHWSGSNSSRTVDMHHYTESTMTLDVVDGKTYTLAWRGWAMGPSSGVSEGPEKVHEAVRQILAKFPPEAQKQ